MYRVSIGLAAVISFLLSPVLRAEPALLPIKLTTLVRVNTPNGDRIVEASAVPDNTASAAVYYVSAAPTDTSGNAIADAVDLAATVGAAATSLGYAWPTAPPDSGLVPISAVAVLIKSKAAAGAVPGSIGFALPRFALPESLTTVEAGGIKAKSNLYTGGAVWEWWTQGKQFINNYDYGRQLSMAIYTAQGRALQETGDNYGGFAIPLSARHPSPTSYLRNSGTHQSSRAIPLDWSPDARAGGKNNPVVYINARIGKELTLDWVGPDHVNRSWPVALYESVYEGPALGVAVVEAPTAYLTAEFNNYYSYEPTIDVLKPVALNHGKINVSGGAASGVVIANHSGPGALAMGVYISDPNAGLVLYDNSGPDGGKYGSSFSKWAVVFNSDVPASWRFRTWIITDTVQNIRNDFRQLYRWGVTSRDLGAKINRGR